MRLILKQTVANLGDAGDVVQVKDGYGRNYLIPQGLAYVASDANMARIEEDRAAAAELKKRDFLEARRRASQLEGMSLTFTERAEDGKLFGSVTAADILEKANAGSLDFTLDKKTVQLDDAIKIVGTQAVPVRLHADVEIEISVTVEAAEA